MKIKSLGFKTSMMFSRFSGSVTDRGSYTVIQTPSNPGYHWGNYIIFDQAPKQGDHKKWTEIFEKEFTYYKSPHHYTFAWEGGERGLGEIQEFVQNGFEPDSATVLTTKKLIPPPHLNKEIRIKKITTDQDWDDANRIQNLCADPKYLNDYYHEFKRRQMEGYRKMSEAGLGYWFGAYIGSEIVGDLGIFCEDGTGRYQSVGTHPENRKKGICGTLVYEAGQMMMKEYHLQHLVMEADPEYHAARIYESVGFQRTETNHALSWWRRN